MTQSAIYIGFSLIYKCVFLDVLLISKCTMKTSCFNEDYKRDILCCCCCCQSPIPLSKLVLAEKNSYQFIIMAYLSHELPFMVK